jgi:antitoxin component of RelBE/YafQ-DinJ toxin-antitoxin module
MLTALETYLAELDVSTGLEVSDLVNQLIRKGANYVKLPIDLIIISEEAGRVFKATLVNDVSAFSRLHQTESFRSLLTVVDLDA